MIFIQYLLPHHYLNKLAKFLAACNITWFKNCLIYLFLKCYKVNMQEAIQSDPFSYANYNDFFTRKLQPTARNINQDHNAIISPADGYIYQFGDLKNDRLIYTKGTGLSLSSLLASPDLIAQNSFSSGKFLTIYLAPHNYHRIHMPITATLNKMIYVPGKLFSVNKSTVDNIPNVFTKNERMIAIFDSDIGKIAVIMVGAIIVGSIVTTWHGQVTPNSLSQITTWNYSEGSKPITTLNNTNTASSPIVLERAQELGLFQVGSTVIILFENNNIIFSENLTINQPIVMGSKIASYSTMAK